MGGPYVVGIPGEGSQQEHKAVVAQLLPLPDGEGAQRSEQSRQRRGLQVRDLAHPDENRHDAKRAGQS